MSTLTAPTPSQLAKQCEPLNRLERDMWEELQRTPSRKVEMPTTHRFTPGLYAREIFMPAGTLLTSAIHRQEHQYIVSKGRLKVWSEEADWVDIIAPFHGITKAGTRRALMILEDTVWTTFHPTSKTTVAEVLEEIIEPHSLADSPGFVPAYLEQLRRDAA